MRLLPLAIAATTLAAHSVVSLPSSSARGGGAKKHCTFTDAASAIAGKSKCSTIVLDNIHVPANTTLDLSGLRKGTQVVFDGVTTFGYAEWDGPLIEIGGDGVTVKSTAKKGVAAIDGEGKRWWDTQGGNGGKVKPLFFRMANLTNSHLHDIRVKNTPRHALWIEDSRGLKLDRITVDNKDGDEGMDPITHNNSLGHNTDGFNVYTSEDISFSKAVVVNQDDCLSIKSGKNVRFVDAYCSGGHGVSIGSVGGRDVNTVKDVYIENVKLVDSENGVRIKTVSGTTGDIAGITFKDIELSNIRGYGALVRQDYFNTPGPTGIPTDGVNVTDVTFDNIRGDVEGKNSHPVFILCGKGTCRNWKWKNVDIVGGSSVAANCTGVPSPAHC